MGHHIVQALLAQARLGIVAQRAAVGQHQQGQRLAGLGGPLAGTGPDQRLFGPQQLQALFERGQRHHHTQIALALGIGGLHLGAAQHADLQPHGRVALCQGLEHARQRIGLEVIGDRQLERPLQRQAAHVAQGMLGHAHQRPRMAQQLAASRCRQYAGLAAQQQRLADAFLQLLDLLAHR